VNVECNHCSYEWDYGGELARATCPSCGRKTPVGDSDDDPEVVNDGGRTTAERLEMLKQGDFGEESKQ